MDTIKIKKTNTKIIAHRGLSSLECENTNSAFVAAGNRNYWGIESDVHRTKDGEYVIFHDDVTGRLAKENYKIEESNAELLLNLTLKDIDGTYNRSDLKIPTLKEYINICKKYEKFAVLELKNEFNTKYIKEIIEIIEELDYLDKTVFISFELKNLQILREYKPQQQVQFLTGDELSPQLLNILKENRFDLDIQYNRLNNENIQELKKNGIKVNCWTCDDKEIAEKLMEYNVDFITTNRLQAE